LKVDNVDPVPRSKDEWLHFWIPAPRLVSEVDTRFQ
jgi:hypothetical protein